MGKNIYTKEFDNGFKKTSINNKKNKKVKKEEPIEVISYIPLHSDFNNCCYRFLNAKKEVIYIGRATNLIERMKTHKHLSIDCYKELDEIQFIKFKNNDDLDIAEPYYISKFKPKYNTEFANKNFSFDIDYLDYKKWKKLKDSCGIDIIKKHHHLK